MKLRGNSYDLSQEELVKEISLAIESVVGEGSSKLVFKTAKLVYRIDYEEEPLPSKLDSFEQFLKKLLGESTCDSIMTSMMDSMKRYKIYCSNNNDDEQ